MKAKRLKIIIPSVVLSAVLLLCAMSVFSASASTSGGSGSDDVISIYVEMPPLYSTVDGLIHAMAIAEAQSSSHDTLSRQPADEPTVSASPMVWVVAPLNILATACGALLIIGR